MRPQGEPPGNVATDNIDFDAILDAVEGDYQVAGWVATLVTRGRPISAALNDVKMVRAQLEDREEAFNEGAGEAFYEALWMSGPLFQRYPHPPWLVDAIRDAYTKWYCGEFKTLDAALGIRPTNRQQKVRQRDYLARGMIWKFVSRESKTIDATGGETPIDDCLFERAAEYVNPSLVTCGLDPVSTSKTRALYYEQVEQAKRMKRRINSRD